MPLRLTLKPNERVILDGAVLRNGSERVEITVENDVAVLRESDVLGPKAVHTACERLYLALQVAYLDTPGFARHFDVFRHLAAEVKEAAPSLAPLIVEIDGLAATGRLYQALKKARILRDREKELINHAS